MQLEKLIEKWALKNAAEYGQANVSVVLGKIIFEDPEIKVRINEVLPIVQRVVASINKLPKEEIAKRMAQFTYPEERIRLPKIELPGVVGPVVMRFAPNPNGYLHIGHAKAILLCDELVRLYGGELLLRFDDTNPLEAKAEYVDQIKKDIRWLGVSWTRESYSSDNIELLYNYAIELIHRMGAYVCVCDPEEVKTNRRERRPCACREKSIAQSVREFEQMVEGEEIGILRLFGDMRALNSVMRDPTLFRTVKAEHFRHGTKYSLWPTYDFACPILDVIEGVTHALRGKEYELRNELYYTICERLALRKPHIITIARITIRGNPTGKRFIRPLIAKKLVTGWDDPRLLTLIALRRRGITPKALRTFLTSFGISLTESRPSLEALFVENRKVLDPISKRYHFVRDPIKVVIENATETSVRIKNHPIEQLGEREIKVGKVVYIDSADRPKVGEILRLKDYCTIKVNSVDEEITAVKIEGPIPEKKVQWVPHEHIEVTVLRPDDIFVNDKFNERSLIVERGYGEPACAEIKDGEIVQFVRYGFVRKEKEQFIRSC